MFIDPKSAPSLKSTPKRLRSSYRSSSETAQMFWPNTLTWPASGSNKPTMCLSRTDFPVPEGPSTVVMASSLNDTETPLRISEEPKRLWMSWTSTVCVSSGVARACAPCGGVPSSVVVMGWSSAELSRSVADGRIGIVAVEELDEPHSDDADAHEVHADRKSVV